MTINKINLNQLLKFVELEIKRSLNILVICNYDLATILVDLINDKYNEFVDFCELDARVDEYYVTFQSLCGKTIITCEFARGKHGKYKVCDIEDCKYLVCIDTSEEVEEAMTDGICGYFEIANDCEDRDEDEDFDECSEDDCDLEGCECDDCMIASYTKLLSETQCPHCIESIVSDLVEVVKARCSDRDLVE
jgi:hypothetical protein